MPVGFDAESRRADRLERPRVRAIPDGDLAGVPHRVRGGGRRAAGADGARRRAAPAHARSRVSAALEAAGQGDQHPVRGRRGVGDGAVVRAGPAVAALHGHVRRDRSGCRSRSRASRSSPRRSSSASISTGAARCRRGLHLLVGRRRRGQRRGVGAVRHAGERVHERAGSDGAEIRSPRWRARRGRTRSCTCCCPATRRPRGRWSRSTAFILLRDPTADAAPQGAGAGAAGRVPHRARAAAVGRSLGASTSPSRSR